MSIPPGTRLGPYEIAAPLGAGGMGEVYRARDTRLGRDVAIKVLPQHLSAEPEVRVRFEREARIISGLNHPNICTLLDVGREGATDFLVMELVEGQTLADRLARGPMSATEALRIGGQVADALDKAHRAGVIHRDLKPGNVMLTRSGAKLMDFGLARATGLAGPGGGSGATASALTRSPTVASPLTAEGTIVGTFQYMSPEQLEGHEADARSDLWALGCVLYEMVTGRSAFTGSSQASLIASILKEEPRPISEVSPIVPAALDRLVRACLAKDPSARLQSAHDVRLQLEWIDAGGSRGDAPAPAMPRRVPRERLAWIVAGGFALLAAGIAIAPRIGGAPGAGPAVFAALVPPEGVIIEDDAMALAVSPRGDAVVFEGTDSTGVSQLWVRELDENLARPLAGTENAILPFWSPDGRSVGFFAGGKLKRIETGGRNVQILCDAPDGRGAAWSPRGVILFAPASAGPLFQVPEGGGRPVQATQLDSARTESAHRFPAFLPDGRRFLYVTLTAGDTAQTRLGSLGSSVTRPVVTASSDAVYAAPGYLIFPRDETLLAQRFDERRGVVMGEPRVIGTAPADGSRYNGDPVVSVSANGVMIQRRRAQLVSRLAWLDREGRTIARVPTAAAPYKNVSISPGNDRVACIRSSGSTQDAWTIELSTGLATRLTSDVDFPENPIWSPDGRWIVLAGAKHGHRDLWRKLASGAGEVELAARLAGDFDNPVFWSADGRYLLVRRLSPTTGEDVWVFPQRGDSTSYALLHRQFHEEDPAISPDGHWIAYRSDESGRTELYVQGFPEPNAKYRVSKDGAGQGTRSKFGRPFWRRDGRELLFVGGDGVTLMTAPVETGVSFTAGTPRPLFRIPANCSGLVATSDAQRFLVLEDVSTSESASIQIALRWPAMLERR